MDLLQVVAWECGGGAIFLGPSHHVFGVLDFPLALLRKCSDYHFVGDYCGALESGNVSFRSRSFCNVWNNSFFESWVAFYCWHRGKNWIELVYPTWNWYTSYEHLRWPFFHHNMSRMTLEVEIGWNHLFPTDAWGLQKQNECKFMCLASASCLEMWKVVLGDLKLILVELVPLTLDMKFSKGGGPRICLGLHT